MSLGLRAKLLLPLFLLIVVSLAHFMLIKSTEERAAEQLKRVVHTYTVISESEAFLGHLRDAETGQRGYLLTLDPLYLEPYHQGIRRSLDDFKRLQLLTDDNPDQQLLLKNIYSQMTEKFAELAQTISFASQGETARAMALVRSDKGKLLMDRIRVMIGQFEERERILLEQRTREFHAQQDRLRILFYTEAIVLVLFVLLILLYVQKKVVRPLAELTRRATQINLGTENLDIRVKSNDEIGKLVGAIREMHSRLQEGADIHQRLSSELKEERDKALRASVTDSLTGLYNRRKFEEICQREIRRARRNGEILDLIILDIDHFKSINDHYGHAYGDKVLCQVAECLRDCCRRADDYVFRIGGEEFVFITASKDDHAAGTYAEILRLQIETLEIPSKGSKVADVVTISAGAVSTSSKGDEDFYQLLKKADERLYIAKNLGRNCVVATDRPKPQLVG